MIGGFTCHVCDHGVIKIIIIIVIVGRVIIVSYVVIAGWCR
jgi:hypothetical protein